jgi:hypothetical protein
MTSYTPSDWRRRNAAAFGIRQHATEENTQHRHRELERHLAEHDRRLGEHDTRLDALQDKLDAEAARDQDQTGGPAVAGSADGGE